MFTPKTALFTFVAACALAMGACQPAEGPADRAGKAVDDSTPFGKAEAALQVKAAPEKGEPR